MANLRELIKDTVSKHPDNVAFTLKNAKKEYRDVTYREFYNDIESLGTAMIEYGMAGKRIAVVGNNCYEWFLSHTANLLSGSVSVPLDKGLKIEELEQCIIRAEISYIFYCKDQEKNIKEIMDGGRTGIIKAIPLYEANTAKTADAGTAGLIDTAAESWVTINDLLHKGSKLIAAGFNDFERVKIDDNGMSIMLFTSGTTSQSKIVMLSQNNIASNAYAVIETEKVYEDDTNLALLPYHHVFGSIAQWALLLAGSRTVYCDGLKYIQKNMVEYGVSIFIGVPLIVESMYKRIMQQAQKSGIDRKVKTFSKIGRTLNKVHIDVRRKIFKSILDAFGGKLRICIIGGAAGDVNCIRGFSDFGITTYQGYGLTETAPILAVEDDKHHKVGSVGVTLKGVELKIDNPDKDGVGEIIAKGENVMLGYYGNKEATDEVLVDGWFHTGDLGYIDKKGFLFITGRKKNVIVLKNGKNVFPEELEQLIAPLPYVQEAVVLGVPEPDDERDLVVTLKLVYNKEVLGDLSDDEIYEKVKADIEEINDKTPTYKRIKRIIVTDEEMVKTTTGKVKRFVEIQKIIDERDGNSKVGSKRGKHSKKSKSKREE